MHEWIQDLARALHDPEAWQSLRRVVTAYVCGQGLQYGAIAFAFWFTLHGLLRKRLAHRLISRWPRARDVRRELLYFVVTLTLYSAGAAAVLAALAMGQVEIYADPLKHGLAWLLLSLPLLILWQDVCFYFTHRLMHTRWLFRHIHYVHHRSREPSPWAAFTMHPLEWVVNAVLPLLPLALAPFQAHVLALFVLHQVARNAHGHAAVETMPRGFARHWFWRHFTNTTHHHLHHETGQGHYGLWFSWWDRWLGTERADYLPRFDAATGPRPARAGSVRAARCRTAPDSSSARRSARSAS